MKVGRPSSSTRKSGTRHEHEHDMIRTCHVGRRRNWLVAELVSVSGRKAEFGQSFVFVRALLQYIKLSKRIL